MFLLVPAEYKDIVTDVDASHYVSSDFFADGFLEYLPSGSRTKIESLVPVETYMCHKKLCRGYFPSIPVGGTHGSYRDAKILWPH